MGSRKVQEMVQTSQNGRSMSPFWRTNSSSKSERSGSPGETRKVIGASYSHADMLNFSHLTLARTNSGRNESSRPGSAASNRSPEKKPGYRTLEPSQDSDWLATEDFEDDDDVLALDEDEDEFGLPSIASMRRKGKRQTSRKAIDPGELRPQPVTIPSYSSSLASWTIDNGDIAEERSIPKYPTARKSEGKILRPQYKDILRDPASSLHLITHPPLPINPTAKEQDQLTARIGRTNRFRKMLQASTVPITELRELAWSGIPEEVRAMSWQILLGYLPTSSERRVSTLERKRKEYLEGVRQAFEKGTAGSAAPVETALMQTAAPSNPSHRAKGRGLDEAIWHQISIDVPRTNPHIDLYGYEATQRSLERILYVWAIRHPASGYVQGINDLVTPFWQTFLGTYITDSDIESGMDPGQLPKQVLDAVEADSYWCLTKLLDGIQDNYIAHQPGIQRQVAALRDLTTRIDERLAKHLEAEGVEFIQFSFRWMNCLLMREISVKNTIRMWDAYFAEDQGFSHFHLYVCAAFLVKWTDKLLTMDFQDIMMFLQNLPTRNWTEKDIELLLSEAFIWSSLFSRSKGHIQKSGTGIGPVTL